LGILDSFPSIEGEDYVSHNVLLDNKTYAHNIKEFTFSFIRLDKFRKNFEESQSVLDKWCYFFKHADVTKPKELEKIQKNYPLVSKAYNALNVTNYTPKQYQEYCHAEMCADAHESVIFEARDKGLAEGKAEGKAEGLAEGEAKKARETAIAMLSKGIPVDVVSQCTGLSLEAVNALNKV
jgi:predicted transposase/invertase (TIGR01784 family)